MEISEKLPGTKLSKINSNSYVQYDTSQNKMKLSGRRAKGDRDCILG